MKQTFLNTIGILVYTAWYKFRIILATKSARSKLEGKVYKRSNLVAALAAICVYGQDVRLFILLTILTRSTVERTKSKRGLREQTKWKDRH